jgi:hypothetical protein
MAILSIHAAKTIAARLTDVSPVSQAIAAFAATGEVLPGLAQEIRKLESEKVAMKSSHRITERDYWNIVDLERFINHHLDDGLASLRAAYKKTLGRNPIAH